MKRRIDQPPRPRNPLPELKERARAKRCALREIARLEAVIRRAEADIGSLLLESAGYEQEIISLITSQDDPLWRVVAQSATPSQIDLLHYHSGLSELLARTPGLD